MRTKTILKKKLLINRNTKFLTLSGLEIKIQKALDSHFQGINETITKPKISKPIPEKS